MKFLILGVSGMVGHTIAIYLKERGHEVIGFSRNKVDFCDSVIGDATYFENLKEIIQSNKYDSIVNCIGILNEFAEVNKSNAILLNSYLPHFIAELANDSNIQFIHLSTDCVFSGVKGQYTEDDLPDGASFYDRTKALGEIVDNTNLTLRNSIVGPDINPNGLGLLNWFMKQNEEVNGFTNVMWTGLTTLQLAKVIEIAAYEKVYGLYNMVNKNSISKYDLLKLFNHYLRNDIVKINAFDSFSSNKSLKRTRFDFNYIIPDYEKMIIDLAEWIKSHKALYPHYII